VAQQVGTPAQLYDDPANLFVAGFIGSPAMNFAAVSLLEDGDGVIVLLGNERLGRICPPPSIREDHRAVVGIRPERIALGAPSLGIPGEVELLEPTGLGTIVHIRLGAQRLKAFATERLALNVDDPVGVAVASSDLLLFDPDSGLRMR
jgi:multiple sugar transport system ATP-binding protein